jgi:hypothetical protein
MKAITASALMLSALAAAPLQAQWAQVPDPSIPRTQSGDPDLDGPAPKTADGRPDLSGVWLPDPEPIPPNIRTVEGDEPFPRYMISVMADLERDDVPLQPWAAKVLEERLGSAGTASPMAYCKPTGVPWISSLPLPYKIVQTPRLILLLHEEGTVFRQIFLDGRRPVENAVPRWMGYSTGRWDGDELVVDTVGVTDQSWLDGMGHPHSDRLHLIERFRRRDAGHLEIEVTIDDPGAYTRPVVYTIRTTALPDDDLLEYFCTENEKSSLTYE